MTYVFLIHQIHTTIFGTTMYFQYTIVLTIIIHMFRVSITRHQELFYEQSLKLRVASQYALKKLDVLHNCKIHLL
jgi:hypothetical protein